MIVDEAFVDWRADCSGRGLVGSFGADPVELDGHRQQRADMAQSWNPKW